ncbi:MAG: O-antigen ligase family protein [Candidatus Magasanikbacteria bacterium]
MKQKIEQVIKWLIYAVFFVPLLVFPSSYIFPFIVPKIIFFRSLVEIIVVLYVLLLAINWQQYKPKFNYLNIAVFLFLLSFAVSTFVGTDVYHSFWDNHERMLGLFTLLHYVSFYFVCAGVLKDWKDWKWAGRIFLVGGFLVMFIAWLQTQMPDLLLNQGSTRVSSTLGNPIYVGGYGLFLMFLSILLFTREKNTLWKWFYGAVGFFGFMGMFWSANRGTMLGLVAGMAFALIGYIVVLKKYPKIRYSLLAVTILGIVAISLLYAFKQTSFVKNIPAVGRAVNTSLGDVQASPRWVAWQIAIESWKEKPIFGWGPNNYFYAFNEHYNPKSLDFGYGETWFDNAHNIVVNTMAVQGAFGLLVYLGVFAVAIIGLISSYRKKTIDCHFMIIGGAFIAAHFVGVITVFEDPTSYVYLFFWLSLISSIACHSRESGNPNTAILAKAGIQTVPPQTLDKKIGNGVLTSCGLLCFLLIFIFNIQPARANQKTLNAIRALMTDPIAGLPVAKEALEFTSPHIDDIRSDIGRSVVQSLNSGWQKIGKDKSNELLTVVSNHLEKNLILHPLDIRNQLTLAQMYQLEATMNNNSIYLVKAESVLEDALVKSPKRQQIIYSLSGIKLQINKPAEAIKMLEQTILDNPRIGESYWRLAYTYKMTGDEKKMKEVLDLATKNNAVLTDQDKSVFAQISMPAAALNAKKK